MIENLKKLLIVREARMRVAQDELWKPMKTLADVQKELDQLNKELGGLKEQRSVWEKQWQQWMSDDGVLRRGQEYNMHHVKLTALETDIAEAKTKVEEQRDEIQKQVDAARAEVLKAQMGVEALKKEIHKTERRDRIRLENAIESDAADDLNSNTWSRRSS